MSMALSLAAVRPGTAAPSHLQPYPEPQLKAPLERASVVPSAHYRRRAAFVTSCIVALSLQARRRHRQTQLLAARRVQRESDAPAIRDDKGFAVAKKAQKVGLFLDVENLGFFLKQDKAVRRLVEWASEHGDVVIRKAVACFVATGSQSFVRDLADEGFELLNVSPIASGKSSADMKLVVEIMDVYQSLDVIVLATCDSDFSHLCFKLRERGKTIELMTQDSPLSKAVMSSAKVRKLSTQPSAVHTKDVADAVELIDRASASIDWSSGPVNASLVKDAMLRLTGHGFSHQDYGFLRFADFAKASGRFNSSENERKTVVHLFPKEVLTTATDGTVRKSQEVLAVRRVGAPAERRTTPRQGTDTSTSPTGSTQHAPPTLIREWIDLLEEVMPTIDWSRGPVNGKVVKNALGALAGCSFNQTDYGFRRFADFLIATKRFDVCHDGSSFFPSGPGAPLRPAKDGGLKKAAPQTNTSPDMSGRTPSEAFKTEPVASGESSPKLPIDLLDKAIETIDWSSGPVTGTPLKEALMRLTGRTFHEKAYGFRRFNEFIKASGRFHIQDNRWIRPIRLPPKPRHQASRRDA
eukprot:TRINITY_DN62576_c0_g1_i1.p1 TRINITY_DN62576_c0_g1~~TRINITY_DN62576_c0_g1_i1.p1  ORF type:complete len:580 (-),score=84.52 TRINITY_DN62576_c0_g1_i1:79-1818(-)